MFLGVDPVTAYSNPTSQFHRYRYANSNPYKFNDPDGRVANFVWGGVIGGVVNAGVQLYTTGEIDKTQLGVAIVAGALSAGVSAIASTATTTTGVITANMVGNAGLGAAATQASAMLDGEVASVGQVALGAGIGAATAGAGSVAEAIPGIDSRAAWASMSQTERTAMGNLFQGVEETTPGFQFSPPPSQVAGNAIGAAISASGDVVQAAAERMQDKK